MSARPGALFVLPVASAGQSGPVAAWITTAGWAGAAARIMGRSWIATPGKVLDATEALERASRPSLQPRAPTRWRRALPEPVVTAVKDARKGARAWRQREFATAGPWSSEDVEFVWQRHDFFSIAGLRAARFLKRPLVTFVAAPLVWEAQRWGVHRPGWSRALERAGELRQLRAADLVCCTSEEVADVLAARGVAPGRLAVTPAGVDPDLFHDRVPGASVRKALGWDDGRPIVGWAGSFRRFHGLETLLEAVRRARESVPGLSLLLVGDGQARPQLAAEAQRMGLGDAIAFTGTVPYRDMPAYLAAMDIAVVSGTSDFHYSPIKLSEYMAMGRAVIAPRVGHPERVVRDGHDGVLVGPADIDALVGAVTALAADPARRAALGAAAREKAVREASWDRRVELVRARLAAQVAGRDQSSTSISGNAAASRRPSSA